MGSLAEFQQRAVRGRYGVPFHIQTVYGFKALLSQDGQALFRFDGLPGYLFEIFYRHKDGGAVCIHSHQESAAGRGLAVRTDCMIAFDKQGIAPASVRCFQKRINITISLIQFFHPLLLNGSFELKDFCNEGE